MNKKNNQVKTKLSFSKISVILMYVMVIGFFAFVALTSNYPPTEFIIAWMGFWCVQAIVTAVLQINKRSYTHKISLLDAIIPYLNEENVNALIEQFIGIEPVYKKAKVVKEAENAQRETK